MMYARARALASLPTGRLPIVPASIDTCDARILFGKETGAARA